MSGAHDVARDAAKRLLDAINWDENMTDKPGYLDEYRYDIETIAEYLGVEED
jgi:hypothetical protein